MKLYVSFPEIIEYIKSMVPLQNLGIEYNSTKSVLIQAPLAKIDVTVERIDKNNLYLTYDAGFVKNMLLTAAIAAKRDAIAEYDWLEVDTRLRKVIVHLDMIEKMQGILNKVDIKDISFAPENLAVNFTLK